MTKLEIATLEIDIDGIYKKVANIKEISLSISYNPSSDNAIKNNEWTSVMPTGGARSMRLNIYGIVSPTENKTEIQLPDFLLHNYCGEDDMQPVEQSTNKYRLTFPGGHRIETEYSVISCDISLIIDGFDEYSAQLEGSGIPHYERINNNGL